MAEENETVKMEETDQIDLRNQTGTSEQDKLKKEGKIKEILQKAAGTDNYEEKLKLYDEALEMDPSYVDSWIQKGFALDRTGKSEEAINYYNRALEIDPAHAGLKCLKGFAFNNLKEYEKSIECYDEVLEINPEDIFSLYQKASALESLGRLAEAMECYDRALEIDPSDSLIREKRMKLLAVIFKKNTLVDSPDSNFN